MSNLNIKSILRAGAAAGSAQLTAGIIALVLALFATVGFTGAAYATIYAADDQPAAAEQTAEADAAELAASEDVEEAVAEGVIVESDDSAAEAGESIDDDETPMYSGVPESEVIEDDAVPMYSGQPGDPANLLRMGIVIGILAVVGFYLIMTGRLNRNIAAMERRI